MINQVSTGKGYPFIIRADPLNRLPAFPTHTIGLTHVGMPEFIMDPLAFGPEDNAGRIKAAYKFFRKHKNKPKLRAILNGRIIKLSGKQLSPKYYRNDPFKYCFREVPPSFEAVNQAYVILGSGIKPGMRFVQIWIDGDDYVLMDDYYRGGVRW